MNNYYWHEPYKYWIVAAIKWIQKYVFDVFLWLVFSTTSLYGPKSNANIYQSEQNYGKCLKCVLF